MPQICVRVDEDTKIGAEKTLRELGIPMSVAIKSYLKQIAREGRVPISLSLDPFYSAENINLLHQRIDSIESSSESLHEHDLVEV